MTQETPPSPSVSQLVDHLFRRESGRMVAALTRSFGPAHLELAEEVVQDALLQALRRWPFHGVPDQPVAWLYRVARNLAFDQLRRHTRFRGKEDAIRQSLEAAAAAAAGSTTPTAHLDGEITDDQLRLVFLCCHPEITREARVALTLKTVIGLSVGEIAGAFLSKETAVAQRITRAQRKIRSGNFPFEVPSRDQLPTRMDAVLEVLYLAFNEGYSSYRGEDLVRADLCHEALRLATCLAASPITGFPVVHALVSLMCFQISRLPARVDADGELVRLDEQDRTLWEPAYVRRGFAHLEAATGGATQTVYHLQAIIAAHHASATGLDTTDWASIVGFYDQLIDLQPSPIIALNRAVAVAHLRGPEAGLQAIDEIRDHPSVVDYYLLGATQGELLTRLDQHFQAAEAFKSALACPCSAPERRFLERRLRQSEQQWKAVAN